MGDEEEAKGDTDTLITMERRVSVVSRFPFARQALLPVKGGVGGVEEEEPPTMNVCC